MAKTDGINVVFEIQTTMDGAALFAQIQKTFASLSPLAAQTIDDYALLRECITDHLPQYLAEDDVSECAILCDAIEDAGRELAARHTHAAAQARIAYQLGKLEAFLSSGLRMRALEAATALRESDVFTHLEILLAADRPQGLVAQYAQGYLRDIEKGVTTDVAVDQADGFAPGNAAR